MGSFQAKIQIIGINPYVLLPQAELNVLFAQARKDKGPIPIRVKINGRPYKQTLIKYAGKWRLYLNMPMRIAGKCDVGDIATFTVKFDTRPRETPMHPKLKKALTQHKQAFSMFRSLAPHYQKEIMRYINNLKSEEAVDKNVKKAIYHLLGKERFVARNPPTSKTKQHDR